MVVNNDIFCHPLMTNAWPTYLIHTMCRSCLFGSCLLCDPPGGCLEAEEHKVRAAAKPYHIGPDTRNFSPKWFGRLDSTAGISTEQRVT